MSYIATIGDFVRYDGDINIMNFEPYKNISDISETINRIGIHLKHEHNYVVESLYLDYAKMEGNNWYKITLKYGYLWYPCICFHYNNIVSLKNRYGLR